MPTCRRAKAKKALQKLAKENPTSYVPHRYLVGARPGAGATCAVPRLACANPCCLHVVPPIQARLLYHEAAVLEAQQYGNRPSEPRLQLLKEALGAARLACQLNPHSLSSAALRATLVVNVLVEESSLFSGSATSSAERIKQVCCRGPCCVAG